MLNSGRKQVKLEVLRWSCSKNLGRKVEHNNTSLENIGRENGPLWMVVTPEGDAWMSLRDA